MSTYAKWLLTIAAVVAVLSGAVYYYRDGQAPCKERLKAQASDSTIMMSEGEIQVCYGDLTTSAAINTYARSIGLASEAELLWSQKQDALRQISKGGFTDGNTED